MTEQEAIDILKGNYPKTCRMVNGILKGGFDDLECEFGQAITMGISALEEILKYREIGTKEERREAREKQIQYKPTLYQQYCWKCRCGADNEIVEVSDGTNCTTTLIDNVTECCGYDFGVDNEKVNYCPVCGKRIINRC